MTKLTLPPEYETEVYRCVRCGFCSPYCPTYEAKGSESWNCRGRIIIEKELSQGTLEVTEAVRDRLYTCTLCRICENNCPAKIQVTAIQEHVREQLVQQGLGPLDEHVQIKQNILQHGNLAGNTPNLLEKQFGHLVAKLPDQSPNLLFSGCVGTFNYPEITELTIQLLQHVGLDFTMLKEGETCCSGFLKIVGYTPAFETVVHQNVAVFKEKHVERIITACPMCYGTFHENYPQITQEVPEAQHLVQVLEELLDANQLPLKNPIEAKVLIYEGCHLGRYSNLYEAPRKILGAIPGVELVELPRSKDQAPCCGGTIRNPYIELRDQLSDKIISQADAAGADMVVTSCPTCYHNLRSAGIMWDIPVINITTAVAYSCGLIDAL